MPTHVRFRLNKLTGEVEEFLVDDQDQNLPEAEHDRIAAEVARVITRHPLIHEVTGTTPADDRVKRRDAGTRTTQEEESPQRPEDQPLRGGDS